jgi:hypothetical protein
MVVAGKKKEPEPFNARQLMTASQIQLKKNAVKASYK